MRTFVRIANIEKAMTPLGAKRIIRSESFTCGAYGPTPIARLMLGAAGVNTQSPGRRIGELAVWPDTGTFCADFVARETAEDWLVPQEGFEPPTPSLRMTCSTS